MIRRFCISMLLCAFAAQAGAATQAQVQDAFVRWTAVLHQYVDGQGRTDFRALAEKPEALRELVEVVGQLSPASHPDLFPTAADVIAYHINAYNILAMYGVIDEGVPDAFDSFFKRAGFFKFRSVVIGGDKTSLHAYENDVIRPLGEPRVHFALNCMVRDCPRLPRTAFLADTLEQQLDAATREFFNKDRHIRLDNEKKTVYLSAILDFYTKDFVASGKARDLPTYVNPYRAEPIPADYRVKFIKYDWTINQQPPQ